MPCPSSVDFLPAMPREASGKLMKRKLREPHGGHDGPAGGEQAVVGARPAQHLQGGDVHHLGGEVA